MSSATSDHPENRVLLQEVRLTNFKSVTSEVIPLSPLTVLVGANSSGKSSVLQAILLLVQAAQSDTSGESFPLNGDLIRLGTLKQIRSARAADRAPVGLGITIDTPGEWMRRRLPYLSTVSLRTVRDERLAWHLWNAPGEPGASLRTDIDLDLLGDVPNEPGAGRLSSLTARVGPQNDTESDAPTELVLKHKATRGAVTPFFRSATFRRWGVVQSGPLDPHFAGTFLVDHKKRAISGAFLMGGLPSTLGVRRQRGATLAEIVVEDFFLNLEEETSGPETARSVKSNAQRHSKLDLLADSLAQDARDLLASGRSQQQQRRRLQRRERILEGFTPRVSDAPYLQRRISALLADKQLVNTPLESQSVARFLRSVEFLRHFLNGRVRYLGPLRSEPQTVMPTSPNARAGEIGPRGEYTAAVLRALGKKPVFCPMPKGKRPESKPLVEAVKIWLRDLEVADDIMAGDVPELGHTLEVRPPGLKKHVRLTQVGVGVSQLLPVIVLCLLAPPDSLVLLEQPELHLHPKTQQGLAEFFIAATASGRQLIIETHSEYLVKRLLYAIARDKSDKTYRRIGFIYSERDAKTGTTTYSPVVPNQFGGFDRWPDGFFDEGSEEAKRILTAAFEKRTSHTSD